MASADVDSTLLSSPNLSNKYDHIVEDGLTSLQPSSNSMMYNGQQKQNSSNTTIELLSIMIDKVQNLLKSKSAKEEVVDETTKEEPDDSETITMTPEFIDEVFLLTAHGRIEKLFKLLVKPSYYKQKWEQYYEGLKRQKEEEENKIKDEELVKRKVAAGEANSSELIMATTRYVFEARKPWEGNSSEDNTTIPLKNGFNINVTDSGEWNWTLLHKAVHRGQLSCIIFLTRCEGIKVNAQTDLGETPLHFAVKNGNVQATFQLLKRGASHEIRDKAMDSPMEIGIKLARDGCCKTLVEFGADITSQYDRNLVKIRKKNLANLDEDNGRLDNVQFDEFGFMIKGQQPKPTVNKSVTTHKDDSEQSWLSSIKLLQKSKKDSKLKDRVRKGIPQSMRQKVWKALIPIQEYKEKYSENHFENMKSKFNEHARQIDLDINRCFREHIMFKERYGDGQIKLFNILKAYANHNPKLGYTQGMHTIAAFLLMIIKNEEDTFWTFVHLFHDKKYDMAKLFEPGFVRLQQILKTHEKLMEKYLPAVHRHITELEVPKDSYLLSWYMNLCLDYLPAKITLRLYDIFLFEGYKVFFSVIIGLLKICETKVLSYETMEEVNDFFKDIKSQNFDADQIVKVATKQKIKYKKILAALQDVEHHK